MFCKYGFYNFHCEKLAEKYGLEFTPCFFENPEKCEEFEENKK
jgi:ribosomal protein S17E